MPKFDCIQNHIILFIRKYRLPGVENKTCCNETHDMKIGDVAYVYNGEPFGLKSVYCSDMKCFLGNLDESSINEYMKSLPKRKKRNNIKADSQTVFLK